MTYHLESIELLLDLLGKHWREAVAGGNLSSSVVFSTGPGIVELDPGAECSISLHSALWSRGYALGISLESQGGHEIILTTQCDRASASVSLLLIVGGTWRGRAWGPIDVWNERKLEIWCLGIKRSNHRRRVARVCTRAYIY